MSVLEDVFRDSKLDKETHVAQRRQLYSKDKSLMQETDVVIPPENISSAENGRLIIQYKSTDYECFYYKKDSSDKLYVILNGARNENEPLPIHKRWTYYSYIDGTVLNIADPMLRLYDGLMLGWYYGDDNFCYVNRIVELVKIAADRLGKKEIVFFGSSGGGYAALLAACNCMGSTAVVINPQIKLSAYEDEKRYSFEEITGTDLYINDRFSRNYLPELIKESTESRFIFIGNMNSEEDMVQINTVCEQFGIAPAYGLNRLSRNTLIWIYDAQAEKPHNAQDFPIMFFAIDYLYKHFDDAQQLKDLFLIFGEFWAEHFDNEQKLKELKKLKEDKKKYGGASVIAVYDEAEHTVSEKVVHSGRYEIEASDSIWNNKCVCDELCKNKLYKIKIRNPLLSEGQNEYSLIIRDNATNELLMDITLPAGKSRTVMISTEKHSHSAKLKLYSGIAGKTQGVTLEADVIIYEIAIN